MNGVWLVFQRSLRQSLRNPAWVLIGLLQPILYLALFGPLLIPVVQNTPGFPAGDAWQVLVPALLVQQALFGTLFVGFGLISESPSAGGYGPSNRRAPDPPIG